MAIERYYTESAVYYANATSTGWGSEKRHSTAGTTFVAAINPISGNVRLAGDKGTLLADYKLFCSDTVALAEHYQVVWGGTTMDAVFVKDTFDMGHHKLVYLKDRAR